MLFLSFAAGLQAAADRITATVDNRRRAELPAHVSPRLQTGTDQGEVSSSMPLPDVTLVLKPSASQQAEMDQLLEQQRDPSSPNYHRWLTPEQYADRFGVSQADIDKLTAWLKQHHLTVQWVARGRNAIAISGTAGQMGSAFHTEVHRYLVDGEQHFANATNPTIPAAFHGVVGAVHGLHDFRMKPRIWKAAQPHYTSSSGQHQLGPDDVATIYDIAPLYNAGIDGTGQKLVVAGQTNVSLADIDQYRSYYGLPANDPQLMLVPGKQDPGTSKDDLGEADLDLELAGSVARKATILYVYSYNVMDAVQYAIDQNLAPAITVSYGYCELQTSLSDATTMNSWANQANLQGITWFAASGDAGAADCAGGTEPATNNSLSVDLPASIPGVTGVGGTEFNEGSGSYWNSTNTATHASAKSYIPEMVWNDSAFDGTPSASGGGASTYFSKPSWQTGAGVPADGARDVPDVSLSGSADHDGYQIVTGGSFQVLGGTSAGPPQFAGIVTLLNQYLVNNGVLSTPGLGNVNPMLYSLASVSGVFHDITAGNNIVVPCQGTHGCVSPAIGYNAGTGYDLATGIGTVDVYNLATAWGGGGSVSKGSLGMTLSASAGSLSFTGTTVLTATLTSTNGGTATGTVSFTLGSYALGSAALSGSNGRAVATLNLSGTQLAAGANNITAQYAGDASYNGANAAATVTITSATGGAPVITGVSNSASFTGSMAPGGIISVFGSNLAPAVGGTPGLPLPLMLAGTTVTVDSIPAPFYYVSPTQLNIQLPYEVLPGQAVLKVINNGQSTFTNITVSLLAPAIFTFAGGAPVPFTTAARRQVITLFITGAGAVTPVVATGAAPAPDTPVSSLPAPVSSVNVSVGGVFAPVDFIGIPTWSVGVIQINYAIPTNAPLGVQPVVVSQGIFQSVATTLTITQ